MTTNELLAVIDREAALLDADNWHAAAAIMREAAEHLRTRAEIDRCARVLQSIWAGDTPAADWLDPEPDLNAAMDALSAAVARVPHHATPKR
ncbi:MAG: hypothetical protein KDI55_00085 [Anaerolineae bacterium]|nr:hypothetical protein [Anaerolineae bacterium]